MCTLDRRAEQFHHCEMGTTMVMASIANNVATIAHVGDSRCYVIRQASVGNMRSSIRRKTMYVRPLAGRWCLVAFSPIKARGRCLKSIK